MAQKWRGGHKGQKSGPKPLNQEALEALALHYVGRFATTRAKLITYLARKLRERGWEGSQPASPEAIAERLVSLHYVDDEGYAAAKSSALLRRGLGRRRISDALRAAGVADKMPVDLLEEPGALWEAAALFARRKRIGPYAEEAADRPLREKQLAAFLRAGHELEIARRWVNAAPGEFPSDPREE